MKDSPTLALCVIARDEARAIARCLDSARPWVDRMVVLDTGSVDRTPEIAQAHGAQVHHTSWREDFSAARNEALALAGADWHLVLDADEWLEAGGDGLREFLRGPRALGTVCVASAHACGDLQLDSLSHIPRLLPGEVRYEGRIHEQPAGDWRRRPTGVTVGHDGYLPAQQARKRGRNQRLLSLELAHHPQDAYLHYQLGKEHETVGDDARACASYAQAWRDCPPQAAWRHDLVVRQLHALARAASADQALAFAQQQLPHWSHSPDFLFTLGDILLDQAVADPGRAHDHWLPLAEAAWRQCLALGEHPELEGSVPGRGSHLARHNLQVILEGQGRLDDARALAGTSMR